MDMEPFYFIQYAVLVYCIVLFVYGMLPVLKKRIEVDWKGQRWIFEWYAVLNFY